MLMLNKIYFMNYRMQIKNSIVALSETGAVCRLSRSVSKSERSEDGAKNTATVGRTRCVTMILALIIVMCAHAGAQFTSSIRIKVNYTPMLSIRETDDSYKEKFLADPEKLESSPNSLIGVRDTLVGLSVFSISSYENIQLIMNVAPLSLGDGQDMSKNPYKLVKAYVNDGSASALNAIAVNKNKFGFALLNKGILRRSLKSDFKRFMAYVYVLVVRPRMIRDSRKEAFRSLITVEYQ